MKKKPAKVEEAAAPYTAKKSGKADDAAFQKVADKIFVERKELLRKLAQ